MREKNNQEKTLSKTIEKASKTWLFVTATFFCNNLIWLCLRIFDIKRTGSLILVIELQMTIKEELTQLGLI
jgi:hypothetical protein